MCGCPHFSRPHFPPGPAQPQPHGSSSHAVIAGNTRGLKKIASGCQRRASRIELRLRPGRRGQRNAHLQLPPAHARRMTMPAASGSIRSSRTCVGSHSSSSSSASPAVGVRAPDTRPRGGTAPARRGRRGRLRSGERCKHRVRRRLAGHRVGMLNRSVAAVKSDIFAVRARTVGAATTKKGRQQKKGRPAFHSRRPSPHAICPPKTSERRGWPLPSHGKYRMATLLGLAANSAQFD